MRSAFIEIQIVFGDHIHIMKYHTVKVLLLHGVFECNIHDEALIEEFIVSLEIHGEHGHTGMTFSLFLHKKISCI